MSSTPDAPAPRPRGRPKGSKNAVPRPPRATREQLQALVDEGLSNAEIARQLGVVPRTVRHLLTRAGVRREREPAAEARGPGLLVRCGSLEERGEVHDARRAAGASDTSQWLLDLALVGPELARVARDPSLPRLERRAALAELLELLAGPEDHGGDDTSGE